MSVIVTHLSIDTFVKKVSINYKLDDWSAPMVIRNNMGVQIYVELKKDNRDITKYPLCITTIELEVQEHESNLIPHLCASDSI